MIRKLTKVGDCVAIILDETIMEHMGVSENDSVQLVLNGQSVIINPIVATATDEQFRESMGRLSVRYDELMRRLAE